MRTKVACPFEKQNIFFNRMIEEYKNGAIPHSSVFEPYIKWKIGKCSHTEITRKMAHKMLDEIAPLLEGYYEKYPRAYEIWIPISMKILGNNMRDLETINILCHTLRVLRLNFAIL